MLGTADGCLVRRFFNPYYRRTHAYHLRIPALLLPTKACCALRQAAEAPAHGAAIGSGVLSQ